MADVIRDSIRESDLAFRFGGEEFVVLLINTDHAGARVVAERIHAKLAALNLDHVISGMRLTASIGVTELKRGDNAHALFERADNAMYQAKHAGRNCIRAA